MKTSLKELHATINFPYKLINNSLQIRPAVRYVMHNWNITYAPFSRIWSTNKRPSENVTLVLNVFRIKQAIQAFQQLVFLLLIPRSRKHFWFNYTCKRRTIFSINYACNRKITRDSIPPDQFKHSACPVIALGGTRVGAVGSGTALQAGR